MAQCLHAPCISRSISLASVSIVSFVRRRYCLTSHGFWRIDPFNEILIGPGAMVADFQHALQKRVVTFRCCHAATRSVEFAFFRFHLFFVVAFRHRNRCLCLLNRLEATNLAPPLPEHYKQERFYRAVSGRHCNRHWSGAITKVSVSS